MRCEATSFILIVIAYIINTKYIYIVFVNTIIMCVFNEKRCKRIDEEITKGSSFGANN